MAATTPRPFAKTEQALTTLHPDDLRRLDEHAAERKVSRAEAIRTFVLDGLLREAEAGA
jgi:hypothetical protein